MVSVNQVKHFFLVKRVLDPSTVQIVTTLPDSAKGGDMVYHESVIKIYTNGAWEAKAFGINDHYFLLSDGTVATVVDEDSVTVANPIVGDTQITKTVDGKIYMKYYGRGGWIHSDFIDPYQISYAKVNSAFSSQKKLKIATIKLPADVNGGAPVAGEDYVVDIMVSNYIALGDENTLVKFGAVRATAGMTAEQFYTELAASFKRNFSRDINKFFNITSSANGVVIEELPQTADYVRGEFPVTTVNFTVNPHYVIYNGDEVENVTVEWSESDAFIPNSYAIADQEYFCAGERGDQYRQVGYPRTIRTKYLIDTENLPENGYDTLDMAFYWVGRNHAVQKSEKHILLVIANTSISGLDGITTNVMSVLEDLLPQEVAERLLGR